ncbi:ADP-heptose:LPS heptosyltransferase [Ignavibacterium album JCM 16511]|uniref:ADP-heptose:LPS heptosyltransferase n=1 Tax=Ignavibacterium album (strain DSM 19864 / JCM 16511 / NBRC 101810 / Mat9-16) TaxID=945713 RepID=I0AH73_IGNAJ|nr:glycosyltransferase family 9 protein [Ignavibacterium album]AFH48330.1 ADP-heptose:LPS heptosyltransferase [Ignavibacterium album JCM 16511]
MNNQFKNILIVRTDRIGDVVLSLPLARIIKEKFPDSKITFLVREYTKALADNNPFIDEVITLEENSSKVLIKANIKKLRNKNFDTAIIVYPTFIISLIIFFSGIKNRVGSGYRLYSFLFNKKVFEHRKDAVKHELEYNLNLLSAISIKNTGGIDNVSFDLNVNKSSLSKVDKILESIGIKSDEKFIIIHPGSGGSAIDLPIEKFKELIKLLTDKKYKIVLTGTEKENDLCNELTLNEFVINLAGKFNLEELIALISKCFLLIANSTGPIHIAAALNKYTFGFYPKVRVCSAQRWGPYTNKKFIYEPELDCKDCTIEQCEKLNCMNTINIKNVFNDIVNLMENPNGEKNEV